MKTDFMLRDFSLGDLVKWNPQGVTKGLIPRNSYGIIIDYEARLGNGYCYYVYWFDLSLKQVNRKKDLQLISTIER